MTNISPSDAEHLLATDLRIVAGKLIRRLREQAQLGDLTLPQMHVLGRLERDGPATLTTLARAEGVRSQSLGETLAPLKTQGLITGAPDPDDGRQTVLSLTQTGRDLILASRASREDWLYRNLVLKLSPAEQDTLTVAVALLKRLTD